MLLRKREDGVELFSLIEQLGLQGIENKEVLASMSAVPREMFIDGSLKSLAYANRPLAISCGQTISQPYIVALMTQALLGQVNAGKKMAKVLEIGTGSGYQTAILSQLADQVYSVERIKTLLIQAQERLSKLNCSNVHFKHGDGFNGWEEHAPYNGIIVTAAPARIPSAFTDQLAVGGRLVLPVGKDVQVLQVITKTEKGVQQETIEAVRFVPLVLGVV